MKYAFTLLLLICSVTLFAQSLTGIWRGNFSSGVGFYKQQYKYEVQLGQKRNKALEGVTYSYRSTVFYGKARLRGIFMDATKNIILKEDTLLEVKSAERADACLMTCYLEYYKVDNKEVLEGTFTSVNVNSKTDCGSGSVYLERVEESDFKKEEFLTHHEYKPAKPSEKPKQTTPTKPPLKKPGTLPLAKTTPKKITSTPHKNIPTPKKTPPKVLPKKKAKPELPKADTISKQTVPPVVKIKPDVIPEQTQKIPVPDIIKDRENNLVKTIVTNSADIKIELYDNGEIDDDTITVYHNNQVIAYKKRLSHQPITINLKATTSDAYHEFVMVADNLGRIPPNTALMVLTTGGKRYELLISSNIQKNAKVIIEYKEPGKE